MKYTYSIIIKRNSPTAIGEFILIPELNMRLRISQEDMNRIQDSGYQSLLQDTIRAMLEKKEARDEEIPPPRLLDNILGNYFEKDDTPELDAHDISMKLVVEFTPKRKCSCCERILPPLTKLTMLAEIAAGTVLTIGTLQMTEGFIPMSKTTGQAVAITQAVLSAIFMLWLSLSGPGMAFMKDTGATIDSTLIQFRRKLNCKKQKPTEEKPIAVRKNCAPQCNNFKLRFCQAAFVFLSLNSLWTDVTSDYQRMASLNTQMTASNESLLPAWLITAASWTMFGFNQLNDPVQMFSLLVIGLALINAYFQSKKPKEKPVYLESTTAEWIEQKHPNQIKQDENKEIRRIDISAKALQRASLLSRSAHASPKNVVAKQSDLTVSLLSKSV